MSASLFAVSTSASAPSIAPSGLVSASTFGAHSARGIRSSAIRPEYRTNRSASFSSAYTSATGANDGLSAESP